MTTNVIVTPPTQSETNPEVKMGECPVALSASALSISNVDPSSSTDPCTSSHLTDTETKKSSSDELEAWTPERKLGIDTFNTIEYADIRAAKYILQIYTAKRHERNSRNVQNG